MKIESIVFMGTPDFSFTVLKELHVTFPSELKAIFTRPDAPKGRGKKLAVSPVKQYGLDHDIQIYECISKDEINAEIQKINPDLIVVVAYGVILPKSITDQFFCLNIHGSLLPKYRGASPLQSVLLNNEKYTGITFIRMNEQMDQGDMLYKHEICIEASDNTGTLHDRLCQIASKDLVTYINKHIKTDDIKAEKQNDTEATYCKKIHSTDCELLAEDTLQKKYNKIRAYAPMPGAYITRDNKRIKIIESEFEEGQLKIIKVKPEGKGVLEYKEYLLGNLPIELSENHNQPQ